MTLTQTEARLRSNAQVIWRPVWRVDEVALAHDVLGRRLVDTAGAEAVRAADVYPLNGPQGWELTGTDMGVCSCGRGLINRRRACPPPHRVVDWTQLQAFVPRLTYSTRPWESAQKKIAAGTAGRGLHQLGFRAAHRNSGARRKLQRTFPIRARRGLARDDGSGTSVFGA